MSLGMVTYVALLASSGARSIDLAVTRVVVVGLVVGVELEHAARTLLARLR